MVAGADSIDDMDLSRHGALPDLFGGIRAPSTLGSHLRSFTWENVRQVEVVNRQLPGELARRTPLLPGRGTLAFIDIDAMQKRVYGHRKQGAAFGHTKIQTEEPAGTRPECAGRHYFHAAGRAVIAATRLRGGNANSAAARPGSPPRSSAPPARSAAAGCSSCGRTLRVTPRRSAARSAGAAPGSRSR